MGEFDNFKNSRMNVEIKETGKKIMADALKRKEEKVKNSHMKKDKMLKLLDANSVLLNEIGNIINYGDCSDEIVDGLKLPWAFEEGSGMIYYARHEDDDIYDYEGFQVSSKGAKGEEFFMGESDGITYVMGYQESDNWDDTYILILDNENKESLTIDE